MSAPTLVTLAGLPTGPDAAEAWVNLDLLTRRVVRRRHRPWMTVLRLGQVVDLKGRHP